MALTRKQVEEMIKKLKADEKENAKLLGLTAVVTKQAEKLKADVKAAKKELGAEAE